MAQGDLDLPGVSAERPSDHRSPIWARGFACVAMLPILGFIGGQGWTLWDEWRGLRSDEVSARSNTVIGYIDINPNPSLAGRPPDWYRDDGEQAWLWAGYRDQQHRWFRAERGVFDPRSLSLPIGRDSIRTIDRPIFEQGSGRRWARVPDEAQVVGLEGDEEPPAYPIRVLDKVVAINDKLRDRPILVVYAPGENGITVFEGDIDGQVVVMGQTGYFVEHRHPLLYDRETESLWIERDEAMVSVSGPRKGARLPTIARASIAGWGDWKSRHPRTRLLVGADRSTAGSPSRRLDDRWLER